MIATVTAPPRPRRRTARVLAGVLIACGLSLSMVLGATPARAYAIPPVPVVVGTAIRVPPMAAAVCATGVGCLATAAVLVGLGLYATKDSWVPWVKEQINSGRSEVRADGSWGCPISIQNASPSTGGYLGVVFSYAGECGSSAPGAIGPQMNLNLDNRTCISTQVINGRQIGDVFAPGGQASVRIAQYQNAGIAGNAGESNATMAGQDGVCEAAGGALYSARANVNGAAGQSAFVDITFPIPDAAYETTSTVQCQRPDGTTFTLTDSEGPGHPDRVSMPSCELASPGSLPTGLVVTGPNGDVLMDYEIPPDLDINYPNCFGPSGLLCSIQVHIDGLPCTPGMQGCVHWARHIRLDDAWAERLDCKFGPYSVPWPNCDPLKRSYVPDATPTEVTSPEAVPEPDPGLQPDPDTPPDPTPTATPTPTSTAAPTAGPNPLPPTVTPDTPPDSHSCLGSTWSYNPVSWIYAPVKCALIWAFVPKTAISVRIDNITGVMTGKVPFSWFAGFGSIPVAIPGDQCPDWRIKVGSLDKNVVCDSSYIDAIRTARPVLFVFMASLALWPLIRSTAYAAFPIIKPQPGMLR